MAANQAQGTLNTLAASTKVEPAVEPAEGAVKFDNAVMGVLKTVFRKVPVHQVYAVMVRMGNAADTRDVLAESYKVMSAHLNNSLSFTDESGDVTDTLRKKSGSSTGFAVGASRYPDLSEVAKQEDLDLLEAGDYVESLIQRLVKGENPSSVLDPASDVVRASLKMDCYAFDKVHGSEEALGSRLIFSSCWIRNSILRGLFAKIAPSAIQAGLSFNGVEILREMDSTDVVASPAGPRFKLVVVNGQPLSGLLGTNFLVWSLRGVEKGICEAVLAVAGDSVYAVFKGAASGKTRQARAARLAGIMVSSGKEEWVALGQAAIADWLVSMMSEITPGDGEDEKPALFATSERELEGSKTDDPVPVPTPYGLSDDMVDFLKSEPVSVFVSDTKRSDLVISNMARYFGDLLTLAAGACPRSSKSKVTAVIYSAMRDLCRPLVAFPGARAIHRADILASGSYIHDVLTMLATAAIITCPDQL